MIRRCAAASSSSRRAPPRSSASGPRRLSTTASAPHGVPVVQAFADAGETVRSAMGLVDGLEAGQRRTRQGGEEFLSSDLGRFVVQCGQYAVDQADPVPGAPALHEAGLSRRVRWPEGAGRPMVRYECRGDERVQSVDLDESGAEQFEVGQDPCGRVGQNGQRVGEVLRRLRGFRGLRGLRGLRSDRREPVEEWFQEHPPPGAEPHHDGAAAGSALRAVHELRLGRPPVDGAAEPGRQRHRQEFRRTGGGSGSGSGFAAVPRPDAELISPAGVPQVAVQVEAEPCGWGGDADAVPRRPWGDRPTGRG